MLIHAFIIEAGSCLTVGITKKDSDSGHLHNKCAYGYNKRMPYAVFFIALAILVFIGGALFGWVGVLIGAVLAFIVALGSAFLFH